MHARSFGSVAPLALLAAACGSAATPPKDLTAAAPVASTTPLLAPAGIERRYVRIQPRGSDASINVSIDVPQEWGTSVHERGEAELRPCLVRRETLATLTVGGQTCLDTDFDACVTGFYLPEGLAAATRQTPSPSRTWIIYDRSINGDRQVQGTLYAFDERTRTTVGCSTEWLTGKDIALFAKYKAACDTLAFPPPDAMHDPSPAVAARPAPEDLAESQTPRDKAIAEVVRGFLPAAAKRDVKAAMPFVGGPELCAAGRADMRETCSAHMDRVVAALPKILAAVPEDFDPGAIRLDHDTRGDGTTARIESKADACADGLTLGVLERSGKVFIHFPMIR